MNETPPSDPPDATLVSAIFRLLDARAAAATVCPSEVARAVASDEPSWRALMPAVRRVAAMLAAAGRLRVTRRGAEVDAESRGGPIRLGRPQTFEGSCASSPADDQTHPAAGDPSR